ncbi:MAG: helix-turn-helix domain-containing protein [Candidatus Hodarchaeota archaeon]
MTTTKVQRGGPLDASFLEEARKFCRDCETCAEKCIMKIITASSVCVEKRVQKATERRPNREFSKLIEMYWHFPAHNGTDQRAFKILPDCNFDLVFVLGDRFCKLLFFGPFTKKIFLPIRNSHEYFCIRFRPGRIPRIADVQPPELVDNAIQLPKMLGIDTDVLCEHLHALTDIDSRQRFIEEVFRKARLESIVQVNHFSRLADRVACLKGMIRVDTLAIDSGMSRRTLERVFKAELGVPPKTFIRYVRLQNVVEKLRSRTHKRLAEIAYDCGYADQSHFIKDFKQLSGNLPSSDASLLSVAFLQYEVPQSV